MANDRCNCLDIGGDVTPHGKRKNLQTLEGEGIANDRNNGQGKKKVPVDSIF